MHLSTHTLRMHTEEEHYHILANYILKLDFSIPMLGWLLRILQACLSPSNIVFNGVYT